MASLGGNILPLDLDLKTTFAGLSAVALSGLLFSKLLAKNDAESLETPGLFKSFLLFFYSCFIKPHNGDKGNQQDALESFYKKQAGAYDATRKVLLQGREDMLALVAAQLKAKGPKKGNKAKRVWVDVSRPDSHTKPFETRLIMNRLVEEQDGTLRLCLALSMCPSSSQASTSLISPRLYARSPDSASNALAGTMSRSFVRTRGSSDWKIMKMISQVIASLLARLS